MAKSDINIRAGITWITLIDLLIMLLIDSKKLYTWPKLWKTFDIKQVRIPNVAIVPMFF
jgi:hypothetical protein